MSADHDVAVLVLEDRDSPPRAEVERWLLDRVAGWPEHDVLVVGVVVGELLDNARRWGTPPYVLELVLDPWTGVLTIRLRNSAPNHVHGWPRGAGLLLVGALTEQWGVVSWTEHTTVWAKVRFDG